jgi:hypothetical protein
VSRSFLTASNDFGTCATPAFGVWVQKEQRRGGAENEGKVFHWGSCVLVERIQQ